jgi:hypothetical protein
MTEAEWFASSVPDDMIIATVPHHISFRKLRLFLAGCCRRRWDFFTVARLTSFVELIEQFADGQRDQADFEMAVGEGWKGYHQTMTTSDSSPQLHPYINGEITFAVQIACSPDDRLLLYMVFSQRCCSAAEVPDSLASAYARSRGALRTNPVDAKATIASEIAACADLFRCVAGNPFRPVVVPPEWRTSTVLDLTSAIYEDRAFDRMAILADALEEAGCDRPEILNHCRAGGEHVRGCWVVDSVLGKS